MAAEAVHTILEAGAHIVAHGPETVPRYAPRKPKSDYQRTERLKLDS